MRLSVLLSTTAAGIMAAAAAQAVDVKIGVLNDRSGIYADLSGEGSVEAARMAIEDFGAAAKGINVTVVSADHQNKPDVASTVSRQWYDQDGVDAIFDVPTSSAALAVNEITKEKNKIFMNSGAGTSDLTGKACSPNTVHWTYDTWALANGTGTAMVQNGFDTWFFVTADYAFGQALERDTTAAVEKAGGKVVGGVRHPFPGQDFSSFLLQAQSSGAKVIGLANAGGDTVNTIKQASEFGITQAGQALAGLLMFANDVHALGLDVAQGLVMTESFYWDRDDGTRELAKRYGARMGGNMPSMVQAGVYGSVIHYLKAVEATGGKDTAKLMEWMKANPTDDAAFGKGSIRADGRKIHDMYLYRVKAPDQSKYPWDYYEQVAVIPAEQAFRPITDGDCPLVK